MRHKTIFAILLSLMTLMTIYTMALPVMSLVNAHGAGCALYSQEVKNKAKKPEKKPEIKTTQAPDQKESKQGYFRKEYSEKDFLPGARQESYGMLVAKTLFVVILLLGGFILFYRFVTKKIGYPAIGSDVVTVLSVIPLGTNKYLQVVDVAGKILVLGLTDNSVNLVTEITSKDEIDRIRLLSSRQPAGRADFGEFLMKQVGKITGRDNEEKKQGSEKRGSALSFMEEQKRRLNNLGRDKDE